MFSSEKSMTSRSNKTDHLIRFSIIDLGGRRSLSGFGPRFRSFFDLENLKPCVELVLVTSHLVVQSTNFLHDTLVQPKKLYSALSFRSYHVI